MRWFLKFFGSRPGSFQSVGIGSRVSVKGHRGTITGGNLHIRFDKTPTFLNASNPNDRSKAINLNNPDLEIL